MIVLGHEVGRWVAAKNNQMYFEANSQAVGWKKDGEIVAGVIYDSWNKRSIVCHIAVTRTLTATFLAKVFDYPFRQLQVNKIIATVASKNFKSIRLVTHMGFKEEDKIKDAHPSGDIVIFTMTKEDCKSLGEKYVKRLTKRTCTA